MGIQDREYYWEDRKRREKKFEKKDIYYQPREPRRTGPGKNSSGFSNLPNVNEKKLKLLLAFLGGGFFTFWIVMAILHINADLLFVPFSMMQDVLIFMGL